jgi:hypothetical protein
MNPAVTNKVIWQLEVFSSVLVSDFFPIGLLSFRDWPTKENLNKFLIANPDGIYYSILSGQSRKYLQNK